MGEKTSMTKMLKKTHINAGFNCKPLYSFGTFSVFTMWNQISYIRLYKLRWKAESARVGPQSLKMRAIIIQQGLNTALEEDEDSKVQKGKEE
ncbi:hypothetical protein WN944_028846 [Citrus x changshan-huyou]|uniref:Uncharacterized protein n=1 Tax=Citrus x changshan-huyou TaxID=2935761 RepID=A0AAP0LK59_9ROSI